MGMQAAWMVSVPVASTVLRERSEKPQRPDPRVGPDPGRGKARFYMGKRALASPRSIAVPDTAEELRIVLGRASRCCKGV